MSNLVQIATGKPSVDAATELVEALKAVVYDKGEGLSVALVIGAIEIAKMDILRDAEE